MISRHWTGICKKERTQDYIAHLNTGTLPALKKIDGFISSAVFTREVFEGTEFLVTTLWSSMEAIGQFTNNNASLVVVPDNVRQMMYRYDEFVRHYDVL